MGQKQEMLNDARNIARSLIELIVDEVMKMVVEREDSFYPSFDYFKLQSTENNLTDALKTESVETSKGLNDGCYPSLANLRDVCLLGSAQSSTSKQGEGDFQSPTIREATAFYRLGLETDEDCRGKSFSLSSLNTETSTNELIAELQSDINNISFDNIELSDSDGEDEPQVGLGCAEDDTVLKIIEASHPPEEEDTTQQHQTELQDSNGTSQYQNGDSFINNKLSHQYRCELQSCKSDEQEIEDVSEFDQNALDDGQSSFSNKNVLQHSKKFCMFNNKHYFPFDSELSHDYLPEERSIPSDQNYEDEEGCVLLTESSRELINIEGETDIFDQNPFSTNPFRNSLFGSDIPQSLLITINDPPHNRDCSERQEEKINTITVVADIEHPKKVINWEEALEVQMNVTEPVKCSETDNEEENNIIHTREYWSNVGLMIEHEMDPTYLGPSTAPGVETVGGMTRVGEKCFGKESDDEIWVTNSQSMDDILQTSCEFRADEKVNYLSYPRGTEKKKKKSLVSRLTTSISCIFRSKKKNSKRDQ
uniref:Uncharacterized protein n=1 Tax=Graphocephala atropunctata TaxID=36148 RepID=A0A1B6MG90_9HEMI